MGWRADVLLVAIGTACGAAWLGAQPIARGSYYRMLPPRPRIVAQTPASAAFRLFGDRESPAFADRDLVDGIDDVRGKVLLRLAEHFSPILRPNNLSVPRHPFDVMNGDPIMHVDQWLNGRLVASDRIPLAFRVRRAGQDAGDNARDTRKLRALHAHLGPRAPGARIVDAGRDADTVLFFDLPGSGPATWLEHARRIRDRPSRIFAHPFIHADAAPEREARYRFVIQYWFFYPLNNSANNHEGDWEHINVEVTLANRRAEQATADPARGALTPAEITRLLDGSLSPDSTIIAAVEYHFHHFVMTLDYLRHEVLPDARDSSHVHGTGTVWEDRDHAAWVLRRRMAVAGGKLATHPLVFVGGNHLGPAELLDVRPRFVASPRRNSHGSYPFPGTWQTVGPFGTTEQVHGHSVPPVRKGADALPWHAVISDPDYVPYTADRIILLPDWEALEPLVDTNDDALARWGWMLLPVHLGFPATASLGAGTLPHVDLGNLAPYAPPFKAQWNRLGLSPDRDQYDPRILRTPISPTTPWALLRNGWGALNYPLALLGLMPGWNVLLMQLMPWAGGTLHVLGLPPPRTFTTKPLPHRITMESQGAVISLDGENLARLLPPGPPGTAAPLRRAPETGARVAFSLFFDDRFALENTWSVLSSRVTRGGVYGRLDERQITSGIRVAPAALSTVDQALSLYVRGGYGWFRAKAYDLQGLASPPPAIVDGHFPSILPSQRWWPNLWYAGAGLEIFAPPHAWVFGRLGYGLNLEGTAYAHRLPVNDGVAAGRIQSGRREAVLSLVFGW